MKKYILTSLATIFLFIGTTYANHNFDQSMFLPVHADIIRLNALPIDKNGIMEVQAILYPDGDEAAASFSLQYDPAYLTPVSWEVGSDAQSDAVLNVNTNNLSNGYMGFLIDSVKPFGTTNESEWVVIKFQVQQFGNTNIAFVNFPASKCVADRFGSLYQTTWIGLNRKAPRR